MVLDWIFAEKLVLFALSTRSVTLFNGVVNLFVDGEFRHEPTSLCLPTLPFQLAELLRDTAEPGCRLPRTGCATAERGVFVKDRTKVIILVGDRAIW